MTIRPRWRRLRRRTYIKLRPYEKVLVLRDDYRGVLVKTADDVGGVRFEPVLEVAFCPFPKKLKWKDDKRLRIEDEGSLG